MGRARAGIPVCCHKEVNKLEQTAQSAESDEASGCVYMWREDGLKWDCLFENLHLCYSSLSITY